MKAQVLDKGKFNRPENWVETEGESFRLFINGEYIASLTLAIPNSKDARIIVVSTFHKVELREDA